MWITESCQSQTCKVEMVKHLNMTSSLRKLAKSINIYNVLDSGLGPDQGNLLEIQISGPHPQMYC